VLYAHDSDGCSNKKCSFANPICYVCFREWTKAQMESQGKNTCPLCKEETDPLPEGDKSDSDYEP